MVVRLFAGWRFRPADAQITPVERLGYSMGVPMGGELRRGPEGRAPSFLIHAQKDPVDANLDRIQVIKGWIDSAGETHERVFDVAASGGRPVSNTRPLKPVGNTVDPTTGTYSNDIGAEQLGTVWSDPEFDPEQAAFYYVRVLQIPTPRHSALDALALELDPTQGEQPWWIQERAYTSPVWYRP
jgi:hypothetical protein